MHGRNQDVIRTYEANFLDALEIWNIISVSGLP